MNWQRARNPDQVADRVDGILSAAADLFDKRVLADISMRDLAERAGLGKASLYHYFKTKEEVFISLYRTELDAWQSDVEKRLGRLRAPNADRIAKVLSEVLRKRERFCRLTVVFSSVLEHNLSQDFIRKFKLSLLEPFESFSIALKRLFKTMTESAIRDFLFQHHALIAGLWPMSNPSPEVARVLEDGPFELFRVDFYRLFQSSIRQLLQELTVHSPSNSE